MTEGVLSRLDELIALKRFVGKNHGGSEARAQQAGQYASPLRGRGMDFSEVRNYQAGDEIRHMEWRVMARTGRPHVKVYQEERERPVVLLADFTSSMFFGTRVAFKSVIAARLCALIAWTAIRQGDRVGAMIYSESRRREFTPRARESAVLPLLASLCDYTQRTLQDDCTASPIVLSDELLRLRRVLKPGSTLVLVSDFYQMNQEGLKHLRRLCAHNDVLACHVCDPLELFAPIPGLYAVSSGTQDGLLDLRSSGVRDDYQTWCDARQAGIEAEFKRLNVPYARIRTDDDLVRRVRQIFPRRRSDG